MEETSEGSFVVALCVLFVCDDLVEVFVVLVVGHEGDEVFEEVVEVVADFAEDLADVDAAHHDASALQV